VIAHVGHLSCAMTTDIDSGPVAFNGPGRITLGTLTVLWLRRLTRHSPLAPGNDSSLQGVVHGVGHVILEFDQPLGRRAEYP